MGKVEHVARVGSGILLHQELRGMALRVEALDSRLKGGGSHLTMCLRQRVGTNEGSFKLICPNTMSGVCSLVVRTLDSRLDGQGFQFN